MVVVKIPKPTLPKPTTKMLSSKQIKKTRTIFNHKKNVNNH